MQPLTMLVMVLPFLLAYEVGSVLFLSHSDVGLIAENLLIELFAKFGVVGRHLPALTLVLALGFWHLFSRQPHRVHGRAMAIMSVESVMWALPLFVISYLIPSAPAAGGAFEGHSLGARLTIAIGAGLYEELVYRMIGILLLHLILADVCRMKDHLARLIAVAVTALIFALSHNLRTEADLLDPALFTFYLIAGGYFGILYLSRGYAIVAMAHVWYDVIVLGILGA
ncbi:MAG: CPBP family intramembrane metalloprotease [Phycisphaerales bacterium]|nr:CPBP family intramembrane metalloprotease [Phycisphaerales bacterium]